MNKQTIFYRLSIMPIFLFYLIFANASFSQIEWKMNIIEKYVPWTVGPELRVGDVDNDGDPDLFTSSGDTLLWYENLQPGWARHIIDPSFPNSVTFAPFDVDQNGSLDFMIDSEGNPGVIAWYKNKDDGIQWEQYVIDTSLNSPTNMLSSVGDIDNDGDIDATLTTLDDGSVVWFENQLPTTSWQSTKIASLTGTNFAECKDMDSDGDLDVVTHNLISKELVWFNNPSWEKNTITTGLRWLTLGSVGDLDDDGDLDVTFGGLNIIGWCENLGDAINWNQYIFDTFTDTLPIPFALSDIDSDSDLDILVATQDTSTFIGDICWYENLTGTFEKQQDYEKGLPDRYIVHQNYPNPFNSQTMIEYQLPQSGHVRLEINNLLGQTISTLIDRKLQAGLYRAVWDGKDSTGRVVPSGVYFYQLETENFSEMKKMLFLQ